MGASGFTDIHNHILPGVDDGSQSFEMSLAMAKAAVKNGIGHLVCTPHLRSTSEPGTAVERAKKAFAELCECFADDGIELKLSLGFEIEVSSRLLFDVDFQELTLGDTKLLLLELDFSSCPDYLDELLYNTIIKGYTPVIAHPERYAYFRKDIRLLEYFVSEGALLQINTASVTGEAGFSARHFIKNLLRAGMVSFICSDAHSDTRRCFNNSLAAKKLAGIVDKRDIALMLGGRYESFAALKAAGSPWEAKV